jgi:hypothetical protein
VSPSTSSAASVAASCAPPTSADPGDRCGQRCRRSRHLAHLLAYDSVFGRVPAEVSFDGDVIAYDGLTVRVLGEPDAGDLLWADLGVEVV